MAWYDQIPEGIQFGDEAKGSTAIGNYGSIMPVASDFSNLDFSNLNLGNMDYSNWGLQNFVPDYQPAPTTPSYQPAPTTSYMDYASPLATSYQSYPTPQPTTAMPYTDYTSPLAAASYQSQPTAQPTSAMPYTDYSSPLATAQYQSQPTAQPTTAVPYTDTSSAVPPLVISPEEQARMEAMFAQQRAQYAALSDPNYIANQQAKDEWLKQQYQQGNYYTPAYDPLDFAGNSGGILNLFGPPAPKPAFDPNNPAANMQQVFYFDNGARGSVPDPYTGAMVERNSHPVTFEPGQTYKMLDGSGNVVGTASTPEEMQNLVRLSEQLPVYSMQLEGNPYGSTLPGGGWLPNKTNAGSFGSMIVPMLAVAGTAFGLNALLGAGAAGAGAGTAAAGAGSAGGAATGAGLAGTAAGTGAGLAGTAAGTSAGLGGALAGGGWTVLAPAATGLTTTGAVLGGSALTGALAAAAANPGPASYGDQVWGDQSSAPASGEPNLSYVDPATGDIVVPSGTTTFPIDPNSLLNVALGADYLGSPDYSGYQDLIDQYRDMYDIQGPEEEIPEGSDEGWTVEAPKENVIFPPPASLPELFDPLNSVDIPTDLVKEWPEVPPEDNEIVVNGTPIKTDPRIDIDWLPTFYPPLNSVDIPPADQFQPSKNTKPDLKTIIDDLPKITSALGGLFGGGSGGSAGGYAGMRGPLSAVFSAKLPKPTMQMAMPRALNFDAYRYGYGPEQSFFTNVPQGAENTSTAYTGYGTSPRYNATQQYASDFEALVEKLRKQREKDELEAAAAALGLPGYAEGGYAVGGAGDGRDDKIPAMLSDGEYVIDAETVALLGNGSNKAGADLLDKFRVNVRKHKGRELAKGDFSAKAKKPEQYLKGRK